jgi:hypothetical protein
MTRSVGEFINGTYFDPSSSGFSMFHGTGQNALGTQSGLTLSVSAPEYDYSDYEDLARYARRYGDNPEDDETAFPAVRDNNDNKIYERNSAGDRSVVRQGVLFKDSSTPPTVNHLVSTKDASHHTASMLEAANKKSRELYRENIQPSRNLSDYSLPLVNRLIKAGLANGPEITETSNSYDWVSGHQGVQSAAEEGKRYGNAQKLDSAEFEQGGRDFVKRLTTAERNQGIDKGSVARANRSIGDSAKSRVTDFQESLPGF